MRDGHPLTIVERMREHTCQRTTGRGPQAGHEPPLPSIDVPRSDRGDRTPNATPCAPSPLVHRVLPLPDGTGVGSAAPGAEHRGGVPGVQGECGVPPGRTGPWKNSVLRWLGKLFAPWSVTVGRLAPPQLFRPMANGVRVRASCAVS
jgi:hypothetical protein